MDEAIIAVARGQAQFCRGSGAPFSARVLEAVAADLEHARVFAAVLAPWSGADVQALTRDAVFLRLLGGLHALSLGADAPHLTAIYPDGGGRDADDATLAETLTASVATHEAFLADFMTSPPQTNEVRRAVALQAGFREVARLTGLPLVTLEIGASAGLLLHWDAFAYAAQDGSWRRGPADAPLTLDTAWSGGPPPDAPVRVARRAACDVAPAPVSDPEQRRRLAAYVWADQGDRMHRLRGAMDVAIAQNVQVERADAADWLPGRLVPRPGAATVLYHSVMFQYVPAPSREAILRTVIAASAQATTEAPLAWLRLEPDKGEPLNPTLELLLTIWPWGAERRLAHAHPHGAFVRWLGAEEPGAPPAASR